MVGWRRRLNWYRSRLLRSLGYREDHWTRVACIDAWRAYLSAMPRGQLDALEISPANVKMWKEMGFRSYESVDFPDFDLNRDRLPRKFDVIIAEHVFEHLRDPVAGAANIRAMMKPGGLFLIATPFLIRIHGSPNDFTRWTPSGLQVFLENAGFKADVHSWGNAKAARRNLARWRDYGWWRDMSNDPRFPLVVWAYATPQ